MTQALHHASKISGDIGNPFSLKRFRACTIEATSSGEYFCTLTPYDSFLWEQSAEEDTRRFSACQVLFGISPNDSIVFMSVIIITGATGFIGAGAVRRFAREGHEVHVFIRPRASLWRIGSTEKAIKKHRVDLLNHKAVEKALRKINPHFIFHFAAYGTYPFHQDEELVIRTNINASANLFMATRELKNLKLIVNAGSSSEYGVSPLPMKESDIPHPASLYATAKLSQTSLAQYFGAHASVPIVTLRFFSVYGPYDYPVRLIPVVLTSCIRKKPLQLSSPLPRRDFVFIEDCLDVIALLSEKPGIAVGEILNVGSGKDCSVDDVVECAFDVCKVRVPIEWGVGQKRHFDHSGKWEADISKIKKILRWKPRYSLSEGLGISAKWLHKNLKLYGQKSSIKAA